MPSAAGKGRSAGGGVKYGFPLGRSQVFGMRAFIGGYFGLMCFYWRPRAWLPDISISFGELPVLYGIVWWRLAMMVDSGDWLTTFVRL